MFNAVAMLKGSAPVSGSGSDNCEDNCGKVPDNVQHNPVQNKVLWMSAADDDDIGSGSRDAGQGRKGGADKKQGKNKKCGKKKNNSNSNVAVRSASPVRPTPANRITLIERAGRSRTKELVSKITEREWRAVANRENSPTRPDSDWFTSPKSNAGLQLLGNITDAMNEMVRRIEQQKRTLESQEEKIAASSQKLEKYREELGKRAKYAKRSSIGLNPRRDAARRDAFLVKVEGLQLRLNEATILAKKSKHKIDEQRINVRDSKKLLASLQMERKSLLNQRTEAVKKLGNTMAVVAKVKEKISQVNTASEVALVDIKDEWQALGVFAEANTEHERQRLWREKKERKVQLEEEEKTQRDEMENKLVQVSPFAAAFNKSKQTMEAIAKQQGTTSIEKEVNETLPGANGPKAASGAIEQGVFGLINATSPTQPAGKLQRSVKNESPEVALAGNLTVNQEKALKSSIQTGRWQMARGQAQLQQLENKNQNLEEGFNLMKERTGIESPSKMVEVFLEREESNFRLFTHVNLLNEQIEELEGQLEVEQGEIEKYRGKSNDNSSGRSILKQLDDKLERLKKKTLMHEDIGCQASQIMAKVKASIASMFVRIGCETKLIESFCFSNRIGSPRLQVMSTGVDGNAENDTNQDKETEHGKNGSVSWKDSQEDGESSKANESKKNPELETLTFDILKRADKTKIAASSAVPVSPKFIMSPYSPTSPASPGGTKRSQGGKFSPTSPARNGKRGAKRYDEVAADAATEQAILTYQREIEITEKNLLQYIGVIEQRVSEVRQMYSIITNQKPADVRVTCPLRVPKLPSTEFEEDDDLFDDEFETLRPLSHSEILSKVSK